MPLGVATSSPVNGEPPAGGVVVDPEERVTPWQQRQILIFIISSGSDEPSDLPGETIGACVAEALRIM